MSNWEITDISKTVLTVPTRDNETGYLVFGLYELSETAAIYWMAPETYTGNILQNYGSTFEYVMNWVRNIIVTLKGKHIKRNFIFIR